MDVLLFTSAKINRSIELSHANVSLLFMFIVYSRRSLTCAVEHDFWTAQSRPIERHECSNSSDFANKSHSSRFILSKRFRSFLSLLIFPLYRVDFDDGAYPTNNCVIINHRAYFPLWPKQFLSNNVFCKYSNELTINDVYENFSLYKFWIPKL